MSYTSLQCMSFYETKHEMENENDLCSQMDVVCKQPNDFFSLVQ